MCGVFGYFCRSPVSMQRILKLLQALEKDQCKEQDEKTPVGGHGAGVCFVNDSGKMVVYKIGKRNASPARDLSKFREVTQAKSTIVLGHVRRASKDFMDTIEYVAATQPYKVNCLGSSEIVSAHNGYVQEYIAIKNNFKESHQFESENGCFVDSEVIPHLFEENMVQCNDVIEARKDVFERLNGNNTVVLLSATKHSRLLHVLHKGQTRGMYVWKNNKGEIILCSREDPVHKMFGHFLEEASFKKVLSIGWQVDSELQQTYDLVHI